MNKEQILESIDQELLEMLVDPEYQNDDNENIIVNEIERVLGVNWTEQQLEFMRGATNAERFELYKKVVIAQ